MSNNVPATPHNPITISRSRVGAAAASQASTVDSQSFADTLSATSQGQSVSDSERSARTKSSEQGGSARGCSGKGSARPSGEQEQTISENGETDAQILPAAVCLSPASIGQMLPESPADAAVPRTGVKGNLLPLAGVSVAEQDTSISGHGSQPSLIEALVDTESDAGKASTVGGDEGMKETPVLAKTSAGGMAANALTSSLKAVESETASAIAPQSTKGTDHLGGNEASEDEPGHVAVKGRAGDGPAAAGGARLAGAENMLLKVANRETGPVEPVSGGQGGPESVVANASQHKPTISLDANTATADDNPVQGNEAKPAEGWRGVVVSEATTQTIDLTSVSAEAPAVKPKATEVTSQIVRHAEILLRGGMKEVHIQLDPPSLGRVSLVVATNHETVSIQMLAETPEVRDAVQANLPQLMAALKDQGIKVDQLFVHLGSAQFNLDADSRGQRSTRDSSAKRLAIGEDETTMETAERESLIKYWRDLGQYTVDYLA